MENRLSQEIIALTLQQAKQDGNAKFKKYFLPERCRCRLQLKRPNGTTSVPYPSFDFYQIPFAEKGKNYTDEKLGYSKLVKLAEKKILTMEFSVATIFANLTGDLRHFINGKMSKNYNHIVYMKVSGKRAMEHPGMRFLPDDIGSRFDVKGFLQYEADHCDQALQNFKHLK